LNVCTDFGAMMLRAARRRSAADLGRARSIEGLASWFELNQLRSSGQSSFASPYPKKPIQARLMTMATAKPANGKARSKAAVAALHELVSFGTMLITPSVRCRRREPKGKGRLRM
jgi:hypothetical protein